MHSCAPWLWEEIRYKNSNEKPLYKGLNKNANLKYGRAESEIVRGSDKIEISSRNERKGKKYETSHGFTIQLQYETSMLDILIRNLRIKSCKNHIAIIYPK